MKKFRPDQLVFVDETAKSDEDLIRRYGYGYKGESVEHRVPLARHPRLSVVAGLGYDGIVAHQGIEGTFNKERFIAFLKEHMVSSVLDVCLLINLGNQLPSMNRYPSKASVLVMDNCRIHHDRRIVKMCADAGVLLKFFPPYSPDLDPVNMEKKNSPLFNCFCETIDRVLLSRVQELF